MKVYVNVPSHLSQAMFRVERAIRRFAPQHIEFVDSKGKADLILLHVIGHPETLEEVDEIRASNRKYGIIQYCFRTTQKPQAQAWIEIWEGAEIVWSYYDLLTLAESDGVASVDMNFHYSPLGLDDVFRRLYALNEPRDVGIVTSGYVGGVSEAIEEAALAAVSVGLPVVHLGPENVQGMVAQKPVGWTSIHGISDEGLAEVYRRSRWVSGLRHVEGFELPALEGLALGARPIVFDRPEMHAWYEDHAVFVPECYGDELIGHLVKVLKDPPSAVSPIERDVVLRKFNWGSIVRDFWECLENV